MQILHIAQSEIGQTGGMARVAWHWKAAFETRGHGFQHIGTKEIGKISHIRHFPKAALEYVGKLSQRTDIVLAHEPNAGVFTSAGFKTIVVSHGLERRAWRLKNEINNPDLPRPSLKTRLFFPIWRLRGCDAGLRNSIGALLLNQDDKMFALSYYGIKESNICVFDNGVNMEATSLPLSEKGARSILFLGTWLARKGIYTLARAADILANRGIKIKWILAGTGVSDSQVLREWPTSLHDSTEIISKFSEIEEPDLYRRCNLFVLPSFFEGQPLALLQAMAFGRCCITSNCCGQKDIIRHNQNGVLFEPGDAIGLASVIEASIDNLSLQNLLGMNARNTVKSRTWQNSSSKVVDFVERIFMKTLYDDPY